MLHPSATFNWEPLAGYLAPLLHGAMTHELRIVALEAALSRQRRALCCLLLSALAVCTISGTQQQDRPAANRLVALSLTIVDKDGHTLAEVAADPAGKTGAIRLFRPIGDSSMAHGYEITIDPHGSLVTQPYKSPAAHGRMTFFGGLLGASLEVHGREFQGKSDRVAIAAGGSTFVLLSDPQGTQRAAMAISSEKETKDEGMFLLFNRPGNRASWVQR